MLRNFAVNKSDILKLIFRSIFCLIICLFTVSLLLAVAAFFISKINFSYEHLLPLTAFICGVSAFADGFLISRWQKENGMFWGIFAALLIITVICLFSVYYRNFSFSSVLFLKTIIALTAGAIGGILGVNVN